MSSQVCDNCTNELKEERHKHNYQNILEQNSSCTYDINKFKKNYSNSFLYLTHLFRNGKLTFNSTSKKKKKEKKQKVQKTSNDDYRTFRHVNSQNFIYNNRADPYKEANFLWNLAKNKQKKFISNEKFHNTFSSFGNLFDIKNINRDESEEKKNDLKKFYADCVRKGFFGRKNKDNIPLFFPSITTCQNEYFSKSEKGRHQKLLGEFGKLSFYLYQSPENKLKIIKDFLIKYHIIDLKNYTNKQLLKLEKLVMNFNFLMEPYKDIKSMIKDTLEGKISFINEDSKNLNYISPYIPKRQSHKFSPLLKDLNLYKNMDLERQKKIYLNDINYNGDYKKIYDDIEKEVNSLNNETKYNTISSKTEYGSFKFITSYKEKKDLKPNMILTNEKNVIKQRTRTIQTFDRSRNKTRNTTISELTDRLYYKPMRKELDIADIKKQGKLTEFVAFTSARNKIFENKLKNLFED